MSKRSQSPLPVPRDRGLESLEPQPTRAAAHIVPVHGRQGSGRATWTHADYHIFWPDWLVDDIKNAGVFTLSYDSTVKYYQSAASTVTIDNYSDNLLADLSDMREKTGSALVRTLQKTEPDTKNVAEMTRGILFLGTPHEGSDLAKWADLFAIFLGIEKGSGAQKNIKFLMKDSTKLRELSENLAVLLRRRNESGDPMQKINVVCFWEERPMKILKAKNRRSINGHTLKFTITAPRFSVSKTLSRSTNTSFQVTKSGDDFQTKVEQP
ncbi:hypothetical protein CDV31_009624 [Fusarium ambrosium]|uniref:Uncharacterized protein n=1 Tax=Fusarium ambrosium TaxID=131363 RepID=A0A428TTN6_9HYPO|nr:hypothetical protein CDV31_009624 [Fusarium ambrosium]